VACARALYTGVPDGRFANPGLAFRQGETPERSVEGGSGPAKATDEELDEVLCGRALGQSSRSDLAAVQTTSPGGRLSEAGQGWIGAVG
jgi:hypothetical protein